jgi:hypothetical protein
LMTGVFRRPVAARFDCRKLILLLTALHAHTG